MINITSETRVKNCNSCGRAEADKTHKDSGFKRISFRVGENTGSNIVILCPKCFALLGTYIETVLRDEDTAEIQKKTCFTDNDI